MTKRAAHTGQHFIPTSLRALIVGASLWAVSLSLTVISGSVAAVLGCFIACTTIDTGMYRPALQSVRTGALLLFFGITAVLGMLIANTLVDSAFIARTLTPITAFNASEFLHWFSLGLGITASLRLLAHRTSYGAILEIVFVASAFVVTLAAHRNGMIHRPFFLGDFALIRGIDPSTILMAFGTGAVLALSALLMMENNQKRLPYHFTVLGFLCLGLVGFIRFFGLPTPSLTDDMGLTGQAQSSEDRQNENPFRDGENTAEDKEAPVAVVVFRDDYDPLNGSYYFRESAYSQFNGSMLDYPTRSDMDRDLIEQFTSSTSEAEVLPGAIDQRSLVRTSIGMLVAHRNPFGLVSPVAYENAANPNNLRFKRTYDAYSMAPNYDFEYLLGRELGRDDWSEEVWEEYLELPDDPRYQELALSLTSNLLPEYADDPFAKAWTIKTYLDENGIYSLKNEHAYEEDPAASFLFGDLTGYCMHFSFAATYMFRSLGIPARVGIGYSVPASNRAGGSALLVQAVHGHAWPEIYFKDIGWVIVDPAPQQTLVDMTTDPQNELQQLLGDMLRDDSSFQDFLSSQQSGALNFQILLNTIYALIGLTLVIGYVVKVYRLQAPRFARAENRNAVSYRALLDHLSAVGIIRRYGESRENFANRVSPQVPSILPATKIHLAAALSDSNSEKFGFKTWHELNKNMNSEINRNTVAWKRALGFLNPFSWALTK